MSGPVQPEYISLGTQQAIGVQTLYLYYDTTGTVQGLLFGGQKLERNICKSKELVYFVFACNYLYVVTLFLYE